LRNGAIVPAREEVIEGPYKAIVSVLVLKEGWDVRNVTTIVGLRAYSAKSNILPEQTLGRGLRTIYPGGVEEYVYVDKEGFKRYEPKSFSGLLPGFHEYKD